MWRAWGEDFFLLIMKAGQRGGTHGVGRTKMCKEWEGRADERARGVTKIMGLRMN